MSPLPENKIAGFDWIQASDRARTVIIECKATRGDFFASGRDTASLIRERTELERRRLELEERIVKVCEPYLRQSGMMLFDEMEGWDFSGSRVVSYRKTIVQISRTHKQLYENTKFWKMAHYRLADWLVIAAPRGLIDPVEVPSGWGLIECPESLLGDESMTYVEAVQMAIENRLVRVRIEPPHLAGKPAARQRLLRNIAASNSRIVVNSLQRSEHITVP